jgi:hypothetical protein
MESHISHELDYKKQALIAPDYRLTKLLPQSGGQIVTITTSGGQETIFEIPVKAFNLSKSYFTFVVTPTAPSVNNNYNWAFTDCFTPFRQLQLYTRSGIYLCDLNEVSNYTKVVWKPETKLQDFLEYDFMGNSAVSTESVGRYLCRNNTLQNATTNTLLAPYGHRYDNSASNLAYTEPKYLDSGTQNGTDPVFNVSIPLSAFNNTIFSLDKDLFVNEILVLRIVWQGTTKMTFQSTSVTDPTATVVATNSNIGISGLSFYLAVDKNSEIVNSLQSRIVSPSGLQVLIPYVYTYKFNSSLASSHSTSYRFNRGHGMKLMKVYTSAFNNTESANTAYDNNNRGTSKINVFYTMLDNERIQEFNLQTATFDDYSLLRPMLKGSVIQSADIYYYNWFWCDDWSGYVDKESNHENKQNLETGLDLNRERKYDFYALTVNNAGTAQYNYYTFAVTQKMLTVSASGITVI